MAYLCDMRSTLAVLRKYDIRLQKRFGQNFLINPVVPEEIVAAAELTKEDTVLEIGPGIGTMTQYLAEAAGRVVAVEVDKKLPVILSDTLSEYDNVTVINEDILKVDIAEACALGGGERIKVVANLPYYITTPILMKLLEDDSRKLMESITVMVQKEVAERMCTGPGSKAYGALSLAVNYYADAQITATVGPECFVPRPNVESAVVKLRIYDEPPVVCEDPARMFALIRAAFNQRRKTLSNALSHDASLGTSREDVCGALGVMGLKDTARGEELSLQQFAELSDILKASEV